MMQAANPMQPVVAVSRSPLALLRPQDVRAAPVGATLWELMPDDAAPLLCSVAGVEGYILREQWHYRVQPGDVVVFHVDPPQGRDGLRIGLLLAVAVAAAFTGGAAGMAYFGLTAGQASLAAIAISIGGGLLVNMLLPPTSPAQAGAQQQQPGAVYSTSLQGNQAALDAPIWKICGRRKLTPPFAAEPYLEFIDNDGNDLDNQQYYYAVFAVGVGNHDIEQVLIGGTPIDHFADVLVSAYLPPGTPPSTALANVNTSGVVSGQILESGIYVGGFAACRPKRTCAAIGIDIVATRGLGKGGGALTVAWRVETRAIDDFGAAAGAWSVLGTGTKTASTNTPQRWSQKFTLATAARVEVRVVRTDVKDADSTALHEIAWGGLRAYLAEAAPLNANTAHYEVVLRASDQLSQLSQRDIALIARAQARSWSSGGGWAAEAFTRTPAWWLLDMATSSVWGLGLPDARIDLPSFAALAATNDARQDRFDYVFDAATDAWSAMQLIARAGRARVFRRNGVLSIARDEAATLGVTAFTSRNTLPGSMVVTESLPTQEMPDGFIVDYVDNRTWLPTPVECPCPGVVSMVNPVHKTLHGITGATHARREGLYEAANLAYRRRVATCKVEMQGTLPAFMSPVRWQPDIPRYGQTGDVCAWDVATLVMGLSEPVTWGADPLYLTLIRDDGSLTLPVAVLPGPTANDITLPAAPDFALVLDDGTRERPKYLLGTTTGDELVKILAIRDGGTDEEGAQLYEIEAVIDDPRVHAADNAWLPGPGDVQDPIDGTGDGDGGGDGGGGSLILVNLTDHTCNADAGVFPGNPKVTFTLRNDGTAAWDDGVVTYELANEWMQFGAVETSVAGLYEVRLTLLHDSGNIDNTGNPGSGSVTGASISAWLTLGTTRAWSLQYFYGAANGSAWAIYKVEIRESASGIVQASRRLDMQAHSFGTGDMP